MSSSYTPRTDAQKRGDFVHINFARELERENAALRADIHAHEQINKQLIEDKRRLDWLAVSETWFDEPAIESFTPETFRAAIDAARKEAQP